MPKSICLVQSCVAAYIALCIFPTWCLSEPASSEPLAGETTGSTAPGSAQDNAAPPVVQPGEALRLKGSVRGAALLTESGLAKLGQTARELERATLNVMGEVTRKELVSVRSPNVLPNGVVIPPMPNPSGMAYAGPLPPRTRQLKLFMKQIDYDVKLLANEIAALIIPDDKLAAVAQPWEQIRADAAAIEDHYNKLVEFTQKPRPDSLDIGREAVAIHDLAGQVNRLRRQVAELTSKE